MNTKHMAAEPVLECIEVCKSYTQGPQVIQVLNNLECKIEAGELVAIVGSSGSGKSTLLNVMGGLDDPDTGVVKVSNQLLKPLTESQRARWRNKHLGFVYQFHHLLGEFTALENIAIPNLIAGQSKAEANNTAKKLLERVGLGDRTGHKPAALSGGERQRVAIARALATSPSCVLMDEPTGNLDPITAEKVLELLLELNRDMGISFVIVTHDIAIAQRMHRILTLEGGRLVLKVD